MFYPDEDINQPPMFAVKRWKSTSPDSSKGELRINVYYPGRIERWRLRDFAWELMPEDGVVFWTRDGTEKGEPLGIPMIHLRTPGMKPAAREAIPIQKALNKLYLDMMASSDFDAWRVLVAFGWEPPDEIEPGTIIGSTAEPKLASIESIEAGDPTSQIALIDKSTGLMSDVSNVPLSLIQRSGQRAAEGTLQEEKEDFIALVRDYADGLGVAYSDALRYARKLENVFAVGVDMDEEPGFEIQWQDFWARSVADKAAESGAMMAAGFPPEVIWRDVWGKNDGEIQDILRTTNGDPAAAGEEQ